MESPPKKVKKLAKVPHAPVRLRKISVNDDNKDKTLVNYEWKNDEFPNYDYAKLYNDATYKKKLGQGTYGTVYLIDNLSSNSDSNTFNINSMKRENKDDRESEDDFLKQIDDLHKKIIQQGLEIKEAKRLLIEQPANQLLNKKLKMPRIGNNSSFAVKTLNIRKPEEGEIDAWKDLTMYCGPSEESHILPLVAVWTNTYNGIKEYNLVMNACQISLEEVLDDDQKLYLRPEWQERLTRYLLPHIAKALKCLKSRKYLYRDFRPANILWCEEQGGWMLIDFSLIISDLNPSKLTVETIKRYAAPEYSLSDDNPDRYISFPTDVYSFGKLIEYDILNQHKIIDPKETKMTSKIVTRMLDKNPKSRLTPEDIISIYS
jgi:serine/threonine protein kinase